MKRAFSIAAIFAGLAACEPTAPVEPGAGVGFSSYDAYEAERIAREQELSGDGPLVPGGEISGESFETGSDLSQTTESQTAPQNTVTVTTNNPGISDEQDFGAVAGRESIESDAERLAAQRDAYVLVKPGALPTRTGQGGALVVEFALATSNQVGEKLYNRSGLSGQGRFDRNCAKYASANDAQEAFLKAGGPERDRFGLDPDGDGFACYWDPTPFRLALGG